MLYFLAGREKPIRAPGCHSEPAMTHLTLVSHHLCPYVQRAAIALLEKAVPFERSMVDLADKPDWFTAISPLGKVPLLRVTEEDGRQAILFESTVICEYIEDTQPGPGLHPSDPLERAQHRGWMESAPRSWPTSGASRRRRTARRSRRSRQPWRPSSIGSRRHWAMAPTSAASGSAWSTRCSARSSATSTCSTPSPMSGCSLRRPRSGPGGKRWRDVRASCRPWAATTRSGCTPSSYGATPISSSSPPEPPMSQPAAWVALIAAGLLDVAWAISMKYAHGYSRLGWSLLSLALLAGFVFLLGRALQALPVGTAYAVWTGIGALGTAFLGMALFGETLGPVRIGGIALILAGIAALKLAPG